jgi:hypothetical protein
MYDDDDDAADDDDDVWGSPASLSLRLRVFNNFN